GGLGSQALGRGSGACAACQGGRHAGLSQRSAGLYHGNGARCGRRVAAARASVAARLAGGRHVARQARHTRPLGMYFESALPRAWSAVPWVLRACRTLLLLAMLCLGGLAHASPAGQAESAAPEAAAGLTPARLADLLDDPATRQQLIERLRSEAPAQHAASPTGQAGGSHPSLPTRIA